MIRDKEKVSNSKKPSSHKPSTPSPSSNLGWRRSSNSTSKKSKWSTSTKNIWSPSNKHSTKSEPEAVSKIYRKSQTPSSSQKNKTIPSTTTWIHSLRTLITSKRKIWNSKAKSSSKRQKTVKGRRLCMILLKNRKRKMNSKPTSKRRKKSITNSPS